VANKTMASGNLAALGHEDRVSNGYEFSSFLRWRWSFRSSMGFQAAVRASWWGGSAVFGMWRNIELVWECGSSRRAGTIDARGGSAAPGPCRGNCDRHHIRFVWHPRGNRML